MFNIHLSVHSLSSYSLSIYSVLENVLGAETADGNKLDMTPALVELRHSEEGRYLTIIQITNNSIVVSSTKKK